MPPTGRAVDPAAGIRLFEPFQDPPFASIRAIVSSTNDVTSPMLDEREEPTG